MQQRNYDFLTETLTKLGFDESFNKELKTKMELGGEKISMARQITFDEKTNTKVIYQPEFDKSKKDQDFYFLNGYRATLTKDGQEPVTQFFKVFKQSSGIDADQSKNLLEGRSVHLNFREKGKEVGRWIRMDFGQARDNGNYTIRTDYDDKLKFNLVEKVSEMGIVSGTQEEKDKLLSRIQNGDRVSTLIKYEGKTDRFFVEATPHLGKLTVTNTQGEEVKLSNRSRLQVVPEIPKSDPKLDKANELLKNAEKQKNDQGKGNSQKPGKAA